MNMVKYTGTKKYIKICKGEMKNETNCHLWNQGRLSNSSKNFLASY